jgi:hypothetical protein
MAVPAADPVLVRQGRSCAPCTPPNGRAAASCCAARRLMCGFYLNELLLRLLPDGDAHETLFDLYVHTLDALNACDRGRRARPAPLRTRSAVRTGLRPDPWPPQPTAPRWSPSDALRLPAGEGVVAPGRMGQTGDISGKTLLDMAAAICRPDHAGREQATDARSDQSLPRRQAAADPATPHRPAKPVSYTRHPSPSPSLK